MKKVLTILGVIVLAVLFGLLFRKREWQATSIDINSNKDIVSRWESLQQNTQSTEQQEESTWPTKSLPTTSAQ
jgi:hypothetical protein